MVDEMNTIARAIAVVMATDPNGDNHHTHIERFGT